MGRRTLQLNCPEVMAEIEPMHAQEREEWRKRQLLVILLAAKGEHTGAEIAERCGMSRASVFALVKAVREGGLAAIRKRSNGGRPRGWRKGVSAAVMRDFHAKLAADEFAANLQQARVWLQETHGVEAPYNRVWYWAKQAREGRAGDLNECAAEG